MPIWLRWCFLFNSIGIYLSYAQEEYSFDIITFDFDQFRYRIVGDPFTYFEADRFCEEKFFGVLAKIYNQMVQDEIENQLFLRNALTNSKRHYFFDYGTLLTFLITIPIN